MHASVATGAGQPDPTFGSGGVAEPLPASAGGSSLAALAIAPGGAIDAVGAYHPHDEWEVLAMRLTEGGALDPTFGSGGWEALYLIPRVEGSFAAETGNAEAVEPDGSIIVGGTRVAGRLAPSGALDTSFQRGQILEYRALAPRSDGSFVAAGETEDPEHPSRGPLPGVDAFGPRGEPVSSFDGGKVYVIPLFTGSEWSGKALDAIPLEGGGTLVAGSAETTTKGSRIAWVARLQANGQLDPSFGTGGIFRVPISAWAQVALAREPSGRIVLVGQRSTDAAGPFGEPAYETVAWGLDANGHLDPSFGSGGEVTIPDSSPEMSGYAVAAAVDPAGRVLVAVEQIRTDTTNGPALLARLTPTGGLDPTYGRGGETTGPSPSSVSALAVDAQSRAIITGTLAVRPGEIGTAYLERFTGEGTAAGAPPAPAGAHPTSAPARPGRLFATRWSCRRKLSDGSHRRCVLTIRPLRAGIEVTAGRLSRAVRHGASFRLRRHGHELRTAFTAPLRRASYVLRLKLREGQRGEAIRVALSLPAARGPRR
jgi:uncharacterized delta-60 repeat protein